MGARCRAGLTATQFAALKAGRLSRRRSCAAKHQFTQAKAIRLAQRARDETGEDIWPYPCLFCSHWHLGHASAGSK